MHARGDRGRRAALLAAALLAPLVAALATGVATVHRCVAVPGGLTELGLRLALVRPDASCPEGAMALGGAHDRVLTVVVGLTVPALLLHLGTALGAAGLVGAVRRIATAVARRWLPAVPDAGPSLPAWARPVPVTVPTVPRSLHLQHVRDGRGPPLPA